MQLARSKYTVVEYEMMQDIATKLKQLLAKNGNTPSGTK